MKLYLECTMGAAGDMLMAALSELLPDKELFLQRMRSLGLPGVQIDCTTASKCGITGTKMSIHVHGVQEQSTDIDVSENSSISNTPKKNVSFRVRTHTHEHEHEHANTQGHVHTGAQPDDLVHPHNHFSYLDICEIIQGLDLAENVKAHALAVYKLLGKAEATVHGLPLEEIRFHEVGSLDAVADIVGCCLLFHMLGVHNIEASPVHVGSGFVRCAHGVLPVPAPATAHILRGVPIYGGKIKGELCTPTGAALLRHFVSKFGDMEPMSVTKIGYGMGTKDFEMANCVRAFLSDQNDSVGSIIEIRCNLDDMTPEAIGFASELLMQNGALDVFATPIFMKKNRPATLLTCLCTPDDKREMTRLILENTTTFGVRFETVQREVLETTAYSVTTPYGFVRIKTASGFGLHKEKPEYEDVRAAAIKHNVPFSQVYTAAAAEMKSAQA